MVSAENIGERAAALSVLRRDDAPMADVMQALTKLDQITADYRKLRVAIVANITIDLLGVYLRRYAFLAGVRLEVLKGSYDNLLGDVEWACNQKVDLLIVIPFFDNLQASWEAHLANLDAVDRHAPVADYLARLELALARASSVGTVFLAGAHLWSSSATFDGNDPQARLLGEFNSALRDMASKYAHVRFHDLGGVVATLGARHAFDQRFYYRAKSPYTPAFVNEFARQIGLSTRSFGSVYYKVLVLDCDNTLWGGIVGEDGKEGIQLDPFQYPGNIFWNVQQQILELERQGVLLCLCSKNNASDVDEIFRTHARMVLKDENMAARRINWDDKVGNLKALALELNLGLDSFIFVDDSSFEVDAVRQRLPMVRVFQVPQRLTDYPAMLREISELFLAGRSRGEGQSKTRQYQALAEMAALQARYPSPEDYLRSLELKVRLQRDATEQVGRICELMNKSNQFNLTTRRVMPGEVVQLMQSGEATVYSFSLHDRFSDHGVIGVLITEDDGDAVFVSSFLMSCRVIGRGVEFSVWKSVFADARLRGKRILRAVYLPTAKNALAEDFFDRLGLQRIKESDDGSRHYEAEVGNVHLADCNWVELING